MENSKKFIILGLIVVVIVIVGAVVIWQGGSSEKFGLGISKNNCDDRFLEWCKDYPQGGVDYDNFGVANRDCIGQSSYRTCDQVKEALA